MASRGLALAALCLALLGCGTRATHPALVGADLPALVPLRDYVADRAHESDFRLSADGRRIAWRGVQGTRSALVVRAAAGGAEQRLPLSPAAFHWSADSRLLVLVSDASGRENFHISTVDPEAGMASLRDLTPGERLKALLVRLPRATPGVAVIRHNGRDARWHDLYALDLATGAQRELARNPGNVTDWLVDRTGAVRGRVVQEGEQRRLERAPAAGEAAPAWVPTLHWRVGDTVVPLDFDAAGETLWLLSNAGRDTVALFGLHLASGRIALRHEEPGIDLDFEEGAPVIGAASGQPLFAASEPDHPRLRVFDEALARAVTPLMAGGPTRVRVLSVDDAQRSATLSVFDGRGTRYLLADLATGQAQLLARDNLARMAVAPAPTRPIRLRSRDGLDLHGYLTLPTGQPAKPLPMVVRVHGGPWYRNIWGNTDFAPAAMQVQLLANRGYAVLEVNFRGSTGYGKRFMEAAVGEFGGRMQDDLLDAVEWAVREGIADPARIAMMGTSYGGYATLVALTRTTHPFACGVAVAAPGDLASLIESFPADWALDLPQWHRYVGNPAVPAERAAMAKRSPLGDARQVRRPLLVIHGENDPRVQVRQALAFVAAAREGGAPVDSLVLAGEGHGIAHWGARLKAHRRIENFFADCLGGRNAGFDFYELGAWLR